MPGDEGVPVLRRWIDSARFRFGTWRRGLRRPSVRRIVEPRAAQDLTVSVVVPVKNAGPDLQPLITGMNAQRGFRAVEIVIVDSGSTDGSAEAAQALGATVVRIAPEEFSHSYARNLGAERARGDYLLFSVQDASPSSDTWLREMFSALQRHQAAAVSCAEQPRPDSDLFYRAISWNHTRFMSADGGEAVLWSGAHDTPLERRRAGQISDTACLIGRELFLRYRHRGRYAEDLDLGLRLTGQGHRLVFLRSPRIIHSHNRPAYYHLKRSYVEQLALSDMLPGLPAPPGDEASVSSDIVHSCAVIDGLMRGPLRTARAPCAPREVVALVAGGPGAEPGQDGAGGPDYLDERTRAFVTRLGGGGAGGPSLPAAESLVAGVRGMAGLIGDYLDEAGQTLDGALLEDFKAALYKGWALHCGLRLASVYWRGGDEVRESMRAIHEELTREV